MPRPGPAIPVLTISLKTPMRPRADNYTNYTRQAQVGGVCERENYTRNYAGNYAKNYTSIARGPWVLCGLWPRPP